MIIAATGDFVLKQPYLTNVEGPHSTFSHSHPQNYLANKRARIAVIHQISSVIFSAKFRPEQDCKIVLMSYPSNSESSHDPSSRVTVSPFFKRPILGWEPLDQSSNKHIRWKFHLTIRPWLSWSLLSDPQRAWRDAKLFSLAKKSTKKKLFSTLTVAQNYSKNDGWNIDCTLYTPPNLSSRTLSFRAINF